MKQGKIELCSAARLSVAPMMDWTDRHCRAFHRVMSRRALLFTEMVVAPALIRGGATHLLDFDATEHPVALQLGGSDLRELAQAARMGADHGYSEINLNVGCPSDRVQSGSFGAILMRRPALVADICAGMIAAQPMPVTVKCRIGVDDQQPAETLPEFLRQIREAGIRRVTIHARKAWLQGLSPKQNRDVPPLDYPLVHAMKTEFPDLHISINGGITDLDQVRTHLAEGLDGVMVGRAAYHDPAAILLDADSRIFGAQTPPLTREDVVHGMLPYIDTHLAEGGKLGQVTRHMLGLFAGQPGARRWRRVLSEGAAHTGADRNLVLDALAATQAAAA